MELICSQYLQSADGFLPIYLHGNQISYHPKTTPTTQHPESGIQEASSCTLNFETCLLQLLQCPTNLYTLCGKQALDQQWTSVLYSAYTG